MLKTESAEQSFNITGDEVNALPLVKGSAGLRNPIGFAILNPSVSLPNASNLQMRVNGMPDNTYRALVDGQDVTNGIDPTHLSESHPSMEALQEVQLSTSNFSAEFGRVAGGLVNLTSRSGSNAVSRQRVRILHQRRFGRRTTAHELRERALGAPGKPQPRFRFHHRRPCADSQNLQRQEPDVFFECGGVASESSYRRDVHYSADEWLGQGDFSAALSGGKNLATDPLGNAVAVNTIYDPLSGRPVNGQTVRTAFPANVIPASRIDAVAPKSRA
jgi:hypothetical protein